MKRSWHNWPRRVRCQERLINYPTTIEEDELLLQKDYQGENNYKILTAIKFRLSEKKILKEMFDMYGGGGSGGSGGGSGGGGATASSSELLIFFWKLMKKLGSKKKKTLMLLTGEKNWRLFFVVVWISFWVCVI